MLTRQAVARDGRDVSAGDPKNPRASFLTCVSCLQIITSFLFTYLGSRGRSHDALSRCRCAPQVREAAKRARSPSRRDMLRSVDQTLKKRDEIQGVENKGLRISSIKGNKGE